jgi:exopolysaccharide biosynthesis polyprenyl glycosylphosphotransferase
MSIKREGELFIPFLSLVLDVLVIEFSLLFAYWLRFYSPLINWFPVTKGFPPFQAYLEASIFLVVVWIFIFRHFDFYRPRRNTTPIDEFYQIIKAVSLGMLTMMSMSFFYRGFSFSRLVFLYIWLISIFLLTISRTILIYIEHRRHRNGKGVLNVALLGKALTLHSIIENINKFPGLGLKICGHIGEKNDALPQIAHLGSISELPEIIRKKGIHTLIIASGERPGEDLWSILNLCEGLNVEFLLLPDLVEIFTSQLQIFQIGGLPTLRIKDVRMKGWQGLIKRAFDILFSIITLIILSPLFFIIGLFIKMDSKGRIFYKQDRVGFDGKEFMIYKFRTMREDAEAVTGPVWATEQDPRRTRVGKFLRRTSLDELPQFFNVLKGDMSVVGPRPERKFFVEKFKTQIPRYLERHRVKSGLTGWAQINGLRGNSPIEERTQFDIFYIENWSLAFDFKIILKTIRAVMVGENSY